MLRKTSTVVPRLNAPFLGNKRLLFKHMASPIDTDLGTIRSVQEPACKSVTGLQFCGTPNNSGSEEEGERRRRKERGRERGRERKMKNSIY